MTKIIKRGWIKIPKKDFGEAYTKIGHGIKGIYALLKKRKKKGKKKPYYNVVYIGMSETGIMGGRIREHIKNKDFSHFSVFQVEKNFDNKEIKELEGLFLTIYKDDRRANRINIQRKSKKIKVVDWSKLKKIMK